jgi:hypothetical protein
VSYAEWRARPARVPFVFDDARAEAIRQLVKPAVDSGGGWLAPGAVTTVLQAAGIPIVTTRIVSSEADARAAAREFGFPLVLKGAGPAIVHKTEAHAVFTGLADEAALLDAYRSLAQRTDVREIVLQPMLARGIEMIVGGTFDPLFGQVVMCGSGGTLVELMRDTVLRLAPLTEDGAREMLSEVRGAALLRGFRGTPAADESALHAILLRVAALLEACPSIVDVDLNPVIVSLTGAVCVDARMRVRRSGDPAIR